MWGTHCDIGIFSLICAHITTSVSPLFYIKILITVYELKMLHDTVLDCFVQLCGMMLFVYGLSLASLGA